MGFKTLLAFFLTCLPGLAAVGQQAPAFFFASQHCRDSVARQLTAMVDQSARLSPSGANAKALTGAYWAMELMLYKPAGFEKVIPAQIKALPGMPAEFQRAYLEMLYTLYLGAFVKDIKTIWKKLGSAKAKAMGLEYLANAGIFPVVSPADPFFASDWYKAYLRRWKTSQPALPRKQDFLDPSFLPGQVVLCSFQSTDRNQPGYLMIRGADGRWLSDEAGKPYAFPQLARSITNLPYYLTNGNTPQGLFRITGYDVSGNNWIGPATNLQMVMPFESEPHFFGSDTAHEAFYRRLLGEGLGRFPALWESYTAGKIGRSEIIAHGTTIDPRFYSHQPYFPNTPSLGCLCSPETWDAQGKRVYSAQQEWISLLTERGMKPQWLIVAEVADL